MYKIICKIKKINIFVLIFFVIFPVFSISDFNIDLKHNMFLNLSSGIFEKTEDVNFVSNNKFSQISLYREIIDAYKSGFYPGVITDYEKFLNLYPKSAFLFELKHIAGESYYKIEKKDLAFNTLESLILEIESKNLESYSVLNANAYYWFARVNFDFSNYNKASFLFCKAAKIFAGKQLEKDLKVKELYYESLLYGAKSCIKDKNIQSAIPVLEFLCNEPLFQQDLIDAKILLFESYYEYEEKEKLISAYEKLSPEILPTEKYEVISLYAADFCKSLGKNSEAYTIYIDLIKKSHQFVTVKALQSAWILALNMPNANRQELLEIASERLIENPLLLAEFRTRLGIEFFSNKQYQSAIEEFKLSQNLLSNISLSEKSEEIVILTRINHQYLTEIYFLDNIGFASNKNHSLISDFSKEAYNLLQENLSNDFSLSVQTQLARYSVLTENWELACEHGMKGLPFPEAAFWYGLSLFNLGKYTEAINILESYVFQNGINLLSENLQVSGSVLYAKTLFKCGKSKKSLQIFEDLFEKEMLSDTNLLDYAILALKVGQNLQAYNVASKSKLPTAAYIAGLAAFNRQDWKSAQIMLDLYLSNKNMEFEGFAQFYLGLSLYKQGYFEKSYNILTVFAKKYPVHQMTREAEKISITCAMQLYQLSEKKEKLWLNNAVELVDSFIKTAPSQQEKENAIIFGIGIYSDAEKYQEGISLLKPYLNRNDSFGMECKYELANLYALLGNIEAADSLLENISTINKKDEIVEKAFYKRGEIFYLAGMYEEAANRFTLYRRNFSSGIYADSALFFSGDCFFKTNNIDQSILQFSSLILNYPESSFVFSAMTSLVELHKQKEEYGIALDMALSLKNKYPTQSKSVKIDDTIQELKLLIHGSEKKVAKVFTSFNNAGGVKTAKGRLIALDLAKLYLDSPSTIKDGVELLENVLSKAISSEEQFTIASASFMLASWNRLEGNYSLSSQFYLESAVAFSSISDKEDKAAESLFLATESFISGNMIADAESIVIKMESTYPNSKWTKDARNLLK